jgi:Uma2 family endonuclease
MASPALPSNIRYADYVAAEMTAESKHEFVEGHIFAMAGGTAIHAALVAAVTAQLWSQLRGNPCRVYSSDLRVRMREADVASYPDVTIVCGEVIRDNEDRHSTTNPSVIVEVLSRGTEGYDRGKKFGYYRTLSTLQEYILVSQHQIQIERYVRNADNSWTMTVFGPGGNAVVAAIGCTISVDELYAGLTLDDSESVPEPTTK